MDLNELGSEEIALAMHESGRRTYEDLGYSNFAPLLVILPKDGDKALIGPVEGITPGRAYQVIQRILMSLDFDPSLIAVTFDAYAYKIDVNAGETLEEVLKIREGKPLAKLFEEQDPHVTEELSTIVMTSGVSTNVTQCYRYTPADGFEWDEPRIARGDWDFDRIVSGKPKLDNYGRPICPMCGNFIPNNATPGEYPGALSRQDNRTEICSDCGTREALVDWIRMQEGNK